MKKIAALVFIVMALASCNMQKERSKKSIDSQEQALVAQTQKGKTDTAAVNKLLESYQAFAETYPDDTTGANYLFKAADFYRYMHMPLRSIELYSKIYAHYPTIAKRPFALFLQGFIYENEVGNTTAAKNLYEKFLSEYPSHPIAKDVQVTLQNLGKSPEELMEQFQQNAAADSARQAVK